MWWYISYTCLIHITLLLPLDYIFECLLITHFSSFKFTCSIFQYFWPLRSFVGWTISWLALYSLCIIFVEPWWMHFQQGGEIYTNHSLGEMLCSKGKFACVAFERGSFWALCSIFTWSNFISSHDWHWALAASFWGIHVIFSQSHWAVALILGDWDFASSGSFLLFHLASGSFGISYVYFLFQFSNYQICIECCQYTYQGGEWGPVMVTPGVMSDWQSLCADVFLGCEMQVQGAMWRLTARGEDQVKGSGKNASRIGPRDSKRSGGVTGGPHGTRINKET